MSGFRAALTAFCLGAGLAASAAPASAQIALSPSRFEAGQNFAAFFRIGQGCNGSPTTALRVQIPDDVTVLQTPEKPGWTLTAERARGRIAAVTWRGKLDAKTADQFGLFVKLPSEAHTLYFPAIQKCEKGEMRWTGTPPAGQPLRNVSGPAPMLQLIAAGTPAPSHYMVGSIMIDQPWSPATPRGATTASAYMTIVNHGSSPDTLLGGSSPAAQSLEIHQRSNVNGIVGMRLLPGGLPVPAGGTITLGPQATYHVMLSGLKTPLTQGAHVPATLNFAKAGPLQVELAVAAIGARAPAASAIPDTHNH